MIEIYILEAVSVDGNKQRVVNVYGTLLEAEAAICLIDNIPDISALNLNFNISIFEV